MTAQCALYMSALKVFECAATESLKCIALAVPEITELEFWLGVVNPNLGEEGII